MDSPNTRNGERLRSPSPIMTPDIITCRPPPRITWKKNGQKITHGWNFFEIPDASYGRLLKIINVKKDLHQDVYTCEAENSQNSGNPIGFPINLNVEGKLHYYSSSYLDEATGLDNTYMHTYIHAYTGPGS